MSLAERCTREGLLTWWRRMEKSRLVVNLGTRHETTKNKESSITVLRTQSKLLQHLIETKFLAQTNTLDV